MHNHDIVYAAFQKYYSSLKALYDFGCTGDFFDDVSALDKFFSEFRNITFVIQKHLSCDMYKEEYKKLREKHLINDTMKWFVDTRNETTKENPFELKKELVIDIYLPNGETLSLQDERLIINVEDPFVSALEYIRSFFMDNLKVVEVFFTSRILFKQSNKEMDLYKKISEGLSIMNQFMKEFSSIFCCECECCKNLKERTDSLFYKVQSKELLFINDYSLDDHLKLGVKTELYLSKEGNDYCASKDIRSPLNNSYFSAVKSDMFKLFLKFVTLHTVIFQMQNNDIMPTFMIIYNDETFRMIPFMASVKSTFYRKVKEIVDMPDFNEIRAVFYCGEYYSYNLSQWSDINDIPYEARIKKAQKEVLSFTFMSKTGQEYNLNFETDKMDDNKYMRKQIQTVAPTNSNEVSPIDWLNPLRENLYKLNSTKDID